MKFLIVCPCCDCGGVVGHCLRYLWYIIIMLMLPSIVITAIQLEIFQSFIYSFCICIVSGWLWSLLLLSCCFRYQWNEEKKNDNKLKTGYAVTYHEYEKYKQELTVPRTDEGGLVQVVDGINSNHDTNPNVKPNSESTSPGSGGSGQSGDSGLAGTGRR